MPWSKPWALSESKTDWHLIVGEERNKLSGANLWWWSCKLGGGQERACKKEVGRLGTKWPISYYTCGLSFLLWKCAGMPMYQLHPGGAGGSYGAMFLDVLVPVCAWLCQIVCGQCWCLLWFGAREASQALGTRTPPHQYTGTSLWWGGIKNDPIRGWQCVLTGTTWWGVFKSDFLSFSFLLRERHLLCYGLYSAPRCGCQPRRDGVCTASHPLFECFF